MKKKKYITPNVETVPTEMEQSLLAGSGIRGSMDSDESGWEIVDNNDPSVSGRSATGASRAFYSDRKTKW